MNEYLPSGQEMDIAETIEIMDISEDLETVKKDNTKGHPFNEEGEKEIPTRQPKTPDDSVEIIDLIEITNCDNLNYLQDNEMIRNNFSMGDSSDQSKEETFQKLLNEATLTTKACGTYHGCNTEDNSKTLTELRNSNQNYDNASKVILERNANENIETYVTSNKTRTLLDDANQYINSAIFDENLAVKKLQEKCDLGDLLEAERRVLLQPIDVLCYADEDGDTPLMIIVSKNVRESERFYENLFAMQERLQGVRVCCEKPMEDFADSCSICGRFDNEAFHTPLSSKNKMGDSALTCAIKMEHSETVIDYLLAGLSKNTKDIQRIFDLDGIQIFQEQLRYYPSLLKYVSYSVRNYHPKC